MDEEFIFRSASDKTDDWPFWYLTEKSTGNLNVTMKYLGCTFVPKEFAQEANEYLKRKE